MISNRFKVPPFSRSHRRDIFSRQALIGLTFAETREFELFGAESPVHERGRILRWETDVMSLPPNQTRWLELYKMHQAACATRRESAVEAVGRTLRGTHTRSP